MLANRFTEYIYFCIFKEIIINQFPEMNQKSNQIWQINNIFK